MFALLWQVAEEWKVNSEEAKKSASLSLNFGRHWCCRCGLAFHTLIDRDRRPTPLPSNVRFWHKADIPAAVNDVRFWG
jgi:hypothetical protein